MSSDVMNELVCCCSQVYLTKCDILEWHTHVNITALVLLFFPLDLVVMLLMWIMCMLLKFDLIPLEVAIILMQDKIHNLRRILEQNPPDAKLLQMQLQGGIATAVNQV